MHLLLPILNAIFLVLYATNIETTPPKMIVFKGIVIQEIYPEEISVSNFTECLVKCGKVDGCQNVDKTGMGFCPFGTITMTYEIATEHVTTENPLGTVGNPLDDDEEVTEESTSEEPTTTTPKPSCPSPFWFLSENKWCMKLIPLEKAMAKQEALKVCENLNTTVKSIISGLEEIGEVKYVEREISKLNGKPQRSNIGVWVDGNRGGSCTIPNSICFPKSFEFNDRRLETYGGYDWYDSQAASKSATCIQVMVPADKSDPRTGKTAFAKSGSVSTGLFPANSRGSFWVVREFFSKVPGVLPGFPRVFCVLSYFSLVFTGVSLGFPEVFFSGFLPAFPGVYPGFLWGLLPGFLDLFFRKFGFLVFAGNFWTNFRYFSNVFLGGFPWISRGVYCFHDLSFSFDKTELLFVPENGSQLFELTNMDSKERVIDVDVFSSRLAVVEEKNGEKLYKRTFSTVLPSNQSVVFEVGDKGFYSKDSENPFPSEGFLQVTVTEEPVEKDDNEEGNPLDKLIKIREVEGKKKLVKKEIKKQPKKARGPQFLKTSSTTPEDSTTSTSEILPKPEKPVVPKKEAKSVTVMTTLDEVTPPSKSLKLADVVFSDRPPKPSGEPDKKPKISTSIEKEPPKQKEEKQVVKPKTRKLNDVVFTDKPKGPSAENGLKVKGPIEKSPMKEQGKKEKKKMKKNKEKCLIS
ncbi:hypothetical protein CAEBREN_01738 [Caenorhabditis brenneri]|uniref:PAN-3 domain-containing protein n=1 Tax=Caenorhabditis brenneri TaxID=135651 RepID=G0NDK0_CAEBE|nr:hypothetical protein CAEBREN_01738 [Caenorhabditis brenneri]